MKPLTNSVPEVVTQAIAVEPTARQRLILDLMLELHPLNPEEFSNKVNNVLAKYNINLCDSKAVNPDIPADIVGKTVRITNESPAWDFKGEVVRVLYRDTAYDFSQIKELFEHKDMSAGQKEMLKYNAYEETRPKIYHRIVLNDENQGILIIPYLLGVNIEQE